MSVVATTTCRRMLVKGLAIAIGTGFLLTAGGCSIDRDAQVLVVPDTAPGQLMEALSGTSVQLLQRADISSACTVNAVDGVPLDVWTIKAVGAPARGTVIVLHGLLDSKATFLPLGREFANRGFDVVLVDHRAHGRSGGKYCTWGAMERRDVRTVMDDLQRRGAVHTPYYVFGVSMGAAIAIMYAADDPRCRGVLAVAAPKDFRTVGQMRFPLMSQEQLDRTLEWAAQMAGFNIDDASAELAAVKLKCPLILAHGRLDGVVPYSHSQAIYDAATGPKELIPFPFNGHVTILLTDRKWFCDQIERLASWPTTQTTTQPTTKVATQPTTGRGESS